MADGPRRVQPVTPDEERAFEARYQATLTQTLGFWLLLAVVMAGAGVFLGFVVPAGIVVLAVVLPARLVWWRTRFGGLSRESPEVRKAMKANRVALLLWLSAPVAALVMVVIMTLVRILLIRDTPGHP